MTNTIPNVPRELLERLRSYIPNGDGYNSQYANDLADAAEAIERLSAPSPAGGGGLEVRAYEDSGGALYTAKLLEIMAVDSVGCEPLCRLSDAQAIIDGLRGKVAQLQSMLATVSKAGIRIRTERDRKAQRIGELEGLLLRVQVSLSLDDTEWGYSGAEKYKLLADIRAALSAGKDSDQ